MVGRTYTVLNWLSAGCWEYSRWQAVRTLYWTGLVQGVVNTAVNLWISSNARNFLASWETVSLSKGTQLQGVTFLYNKHEAAYLNAVLTQPSVCKAVTDYKSVILFTQLQYRHVGYITTRLFLISYTLYRDYRGTLLVVQLVEAMRCKPEGRGLDSRWCIWNFPLT